MSEGDRSDSRGDRYGYTRMPRRVTQPQPARVDRLEYGRFRNVYLYITEACQLRCQHCYMGERLDRAKKMPLPEIASTLETWRKLGGSKLTLLGGEPTLHPDFVDSVRVAHDLGYEHVITTTNGLKPAWRKLAGMHPEDFAYVQISLDGGSVASHDAVRGRGTFDEAVETIRSLCGNGFDVRIICTVNRANRGDSLRLLDLADSTGASLVKYHVFSSIGTGHTNENLAMSPGEWIDFCDELKTVADGYTTRVWYQPTYARRSEVDQYGDEGYRGCIGRTLDRISIFPDGRCYVCSYLFDTDLHFAEMVDGQVRLNDGPNEFNLFTGSLTRSACGGCKARSTCQGGCPAEELVMGSSSCSQEAEIVPVCRLWKSDAKTAMPVDTH